MLGEIFSSCVEQSPAESDPLILWREIKFEDLAPVRKSRNPIASITRVSADTVVEIENREPAAVADGFLPPGRTTARHHLVEFPARDDATIGVEPGRIVDIRDGLRIACPCPADGNHSLGHAAMLGLRPVIAQDLGHGFFYRGCCCRRSLWLRSRGRVAEGVCGRAGLCGRPAAAPGV